MKSQRIRNEIKLQSKRNVELWIYSFADMYMILSVFFIALSVIFAAKMTAKHREELRIATAGRGPSAVTSAAELTFESGKVEISEGSMKELELFLPAARAVPLAFIDVEGYADRARPGKDSGFSSNLDLSSQRGVKVAEWLIARGVPSARVRVFSYGDGHQWARSEAESNRRVVVKLSVPGGSDD